MDYWPYESGIRFPLDGKRIDFPEEFLENHSLILGKTGTGKSSLLAHLIKIYEETGKRVIVFDPHGELWKYSGEESSIITLSQYPGEDQGYLKFNMMSVMPYTNSREKAINEDMVIQTLKDIFSTEEAFSIGTWGPRIELIFTLIPRLLLKYRISPNIQDILDILINYHKRKDFMASLDQEERIQLYSVFNQGYDFISSSVNKILPLLSGNLQRNLFSSRHDFYDISKVKGTLYIELSNDLSPSSVVKPFSVMLLYKIWNNIVLGRMKDVLVVMDEFQIISPHISYRIVTEGRKFSLWALMATQSFSNLAPTIRESLKTNVHNFFLFQLSSEDLHLFQRDGRNFETPDFHYFHCFVPRTNSTFSGTSRPPKQTREFSVTREFYSFREEQESGSALKAEDINPLYLNELISNGLATLQNGKIELSEEYYEKIGSRPRKGNESIYHRYLITRSYLYFKSRGYEVYENMEVNGKFPDLVLFRGELKIPIECEYSDIHNRGRIMEKKRFYGNIIFSTFKNYRDAIPEDSPVLLIPPLGDTSEPELVEPVMLENA
jgi:hypothetical protein